MTGSKKKIGKMIKNRRELLGLSQVQLAKMTSIGTPQFICNIEGGRSMVPMSRLRRVCKVLFIDRNQIRKMYLSIYDQELCKELNIQPTKKPKGKKR